MSKDNGGPAFPQGKGAGDMWVTDGGMTLRDYFAAKAIAGICAHRDSWGLTSPHALAALAYNIADAMLAERAK